MSDEEEMGRAGRMVSQAEAGVARVKASRSPAEEGAISASTPPRALPAIGTFGPYAIVGRLAMGGMAEILLAREDAGDAGSRHIVIKRILPEYGSEPAFVDMFQDEARMMMRLRHPNVCHVYRYGQHESVHYIAMEWVQGASLGKLIRQARKTGGVPVAVACHIVACIADALDNAHNAEAEDGSALSIVHRDVTPDNIMISYEGAVKLLDFGIAKAEARSHKTQAGVVKGKFAYMAPEQCRGKALDHRVDIFALGVCLYETITQRPLYRRDTEFETMEAIVRGPVPTLAERTANPPPELEHIIAKCLAKKADDRWASASELQEALHSYISKRGEVVTGRRVKDMMSELFAQEKLRGPIVDSVPFGSSYHSPSEEKELFQIDSGMAKAFTDDLPMPEMMPVLEMPTVPPPAAARRAAAEEGESLRLPLPPPTPTAMLADENVRPGRIPSIAPEPSLRRDRRPPPTAPARVTQAGSGRPPIFLGLSLGGLLAGIGGLVLLAAVAAGAWITWGGPSADEGRRPTGPALPLSGSLVMTTSPAGAELLVDGEPRGITPITVEELSTGSHRVEIRLAGHVTHEGTVEIRAGRSRSVLQELVALPPEGTPEAGGEVPMGRVHLTSTPIVRVFHDGTDLGETPLRNLALPVGVVPLELQLPNGDRVPRAVLVSADETRSTHLNL